MSCFQTWFPLTSAQIIRLKSGDANEAYATGHGHARIACGKLLGKKIAIFPFKTPVFSVFNMLLIVEKIVQLVFRVLQLYCGPTKEKIENFHATFKEILDYSLLFVIFPIVRVSEIMMLACSIFNPKIYYKEPEQVPQTIRVDYYFKRCVSILEQLMQYDELSIETKASLHELESGVRATQNVFKNIDQKEKCFKICYELVKSLRYQINRQTLENLRNTLTKWNKELVIRLPLILEDQIVKKIPLVGDQDLMIVGAEWNDGINYSSIPNTGSANCANISDQRTLS